MKTKRNLAASLLIILVTLLTFIGCSKSSDNMSTGNKETSNVTNKGKKFTLVPSESKLEWVGKKVTGQHEGTVDLKRGELNAENGKLTGGNFEIDFTTIKNLDISDTASKAKLVNHLKSDDFFSAQSHPIGKFEITSITPLPDNSGNNAKIGGKLTIKGITKEISFPANVQVTDNHVNAEADFNIDRTLWDIKFRSGKFYENLGDNMINDDFNIKLNLVAK